MGLTPHTACKDATLQDSEKLPEPSYVLSYITASLPSTTASESSKSSFKCLRSPAESETFEVRKTELGVWLRWCTLTPLGLRTTGSSVGNTSVKLAVDGGLDGAGLGGDGFGICGGCALRGIRRSGTGTGGSSGAGGTGEGMLGVGGGSSGGRGCKGGGADGTGGGDSMGPMGGGCDGGSLGGGDPSGG